MSRLVIGVGNRWAQDDGAGLEVAAQVQAAGLRAIGHGGDCAHLLAVWAPDDDVVLVDAAVSGAPPGTVHRHDALAHPLPRVLRGSTTHAFGVAETVELARALGRLPRRLEVIGIEGACFDAGHGLTPGVGRAVDTVARELTRDA